MRKVPEVPATVLPPSESWFAWFAMNRTGIGKTLLAVSVLLRFALHFQGHTEAADAMKAIADLFIGTSMATLAAGKFRSDEYEEVKLHEKIRSRSGQYPAVHSPRG